MCGPTNLVWEQVCDNLHGVRPPATALAYGGLKITWVRNTFLNLPEGANAVTTQQYARAYMFQVWLYYLEIRAKVDCIAAFSCC